MDWASVPKAAIYKYGDPQFGKNEVRFAEDGLMPAPSSYALDAKHADHGQLGAFVPTRANESHDR
jgi:hypothetical protein